MNNVKLGISADKSGGSHSNVKQCKDCGLYSNCQGPVPSVGPLDARLVIVGESPGTEEDQKGEPFVGDTGKLLTFMLKEAGLVRSQCRITNATSSSLTVSLIPPLAIVLRIFSHYQNGRILSEQLSHPLLFLYSLTLIKSIPRVLFQNRCRRTLTLQ